MKVTMDRNNSTLKISFDGRLDTVTTPGVEAQLKDCLDGVTTLILDLEFLDYISSCGLRMFLGFQKKMSKQGVMEVHNVNDLVREVFDVTGFSDILTIVNP